MIAEGGPRCHKCGKLATRHDIDGGWWPPCRCGFDYLLWNDEKLPDRLRSRAGEREGKQMADYCACAKTSHDIQVVHRRDCPEHESNREQAIRADERAKARADVLREVAKMLDGLERDQAQFKTLAETLAFDSGFWNCHHKARVAVEQLAASPPTPPAPEADKTEPKP